MVLPSFPSVFYMNKFSRALAVVAAALVAIPSSGSAAPASFVSPPSFNQSLTLTATSNDNWESKAAPAYTNDPSLRMYFTPPTGVKTFTITVSATKLVNSVQTAVDLSNATCFFRNSNGSASSSSTNQGETLATLSTTNPTQSNVTCEFTSLSLVGAFIYVGDPQGDFGGIQFWLEASPSGSGVRATSAPAPVKYSGPEFSGLSLKPALAGSSATLEGRKLDQISSVTIGGKAAVLSNATDKSVNIGLPAGLAPGVYDLVVTTANHGKLTHMNAIRIREELPATSLTIKGTGVLSGEEFKKLTAFARTQNPDMNTVTCIVNSGSEGKSFTQARALCDRIAAANLNIKTTQFETRSTVKSSAVFARVVFSSEE